MNKSQKELVLMDCRIMLKKLGDIPFDLSYEILQKDLWNIGNKYGITGPEVFMILMDNFPRDEQNSWKELPPNKANGNQKSLGHLKGAKTTAR